MGFRSWGLEAAASSAVPSKHEVVNTTSEYLPEIDIRTSVRLRRYDDDFVVRLSADESMAVWTVSPIHRTTAVARSPTSLSQGMCLKP